MRVNSEHLGTVQLMTPNTAIAGSMGTIRIIFRAGRYGIDDSGSFCLAWRTVSDMQMPQFDHPIDGGYTTVNSTTKAKLRVSRVKYMRPYQHCIKIQVVEGYLRENEELEIVIGDTSYGSPGIRMQSFYEREFELLPLIDACGTERYERMTNSLKMEILPGEADILQVVAPTMVEPGEKFQVALRVIDRYGNIALDKIGQVSLHIPGLSPEDGIFPPTAQFELGNNGVVHISGFEIMKEGTYHIVAKDQSTGKTASSNACVIKANPEKKLFWGDMHGQTRETFGCGRLDDYFAFGRDYGLISFTSWQGNDFEISDSDWNDVRAMVKQFNEEGRYIVYLGYEWSGTTNAGGDHNVFFLGDSETFYPSSNWLAVEDTDPQNNAFPITELHKRFHGRQDVMLTPHIGGRPGSLDFYNEELMHTIEILSDHGIFEWFAMDAMKRRLKVGFVATSDDHVGKPGLSYPSISDKEQAGSFAIRSGLTGVFANVLSKDSIWDALKKRNCYASTIDRLFLETRIGEQIMGNEFSLPSGKHTFKLNVAGSNAIDAIFIYDWDMLLGRFDMLPKHKNILRISFNGVKNRGRSKRADWTGSIKVFGGKIRSVKKCYTRDSKEPVLDNDTRITFSARTDGEIKGFLLDMEMDDVTAVKIQTAQGIFDFTCGELRKAKRITQKMGGENLIMEADFANIIAEDEEERLSSASCELEYELAEEPGEHAYWVKVLQDDGNAAWSSPIFVKQMTINQVNN